MTGHSTVDSHSTADPQSTVDAKARRRWGRRAGILALLSPALLVVGVFFVAGVGLAVAQSLGYQPYLPGYRLSLDAYRRLWHDPAVRASLPVTLRVSVLSTVVAAVTAIGVAWLIRRSRRGRALAAGVLGANLAVPHLVGAVSVLLLLSQGGLLSRLAHAAGLTATPADFPQLVNDGFGWGIIAEYGWKETPFLAVIVLASWGSGLDDLHNAARVLGAGRLRRLVHVSLPVLAPPLAAGAVLVFAFAAGSYEVPYLLGRPYPATLPVVALRYYRDTDLTSRPAAMAVAVLIAVLSLLAVVAYLRLVARLSGRAL